MEAFYVFDRDGNGIISHAELTFAMMNLGERMTKDEIRNMIKMGDLDGDAGINYAGTHLHHKIIEHKNRTHQRYFYADNSIKVPIRHQETS